VIIALVSAYKLNRGGIVSRAQELQGEWRFSERGVYVKWIARERLFIVERYQILRFEIRGL
jgi:hypothetical protein